MAVQDRESASLLAQECLLRLPDLLTREHNIHFVNDVLDFVEDVEEERASVLKKQFEASAGSKTDKKTPPPAAAADKMMKAAGELVKCPDGVAGNECRKKNAGAVVASLGGGSTQGGNDNSPRGPRKPDVSELSPLAAYAAAELSFSKLVDAANEFEKIRSARALNPAANASPAAARADAAPKTEKRRPVQSGARRSLRRAMTLRKAN